MQTQGGQLHIRSKVDLYLMETIRWQFHLTSNLKEKLICICWSFCLQDVQVYRYYRDLINFKCRGDPSSMLKCINPREVSIRLSLINYY